MAGRRLIDILGLIRAEERNHPGTASLCRVSADVVAVSGAGIMLMSEDVARGSLCSSDEVSKLIEDLQYTLGEGPCVDAYTQDRPVLEPNLIDAGTSRWPAFTPPAVEAGARALFGFPLRVGAARLGALNLYRDGPGPLSDEQHSDALLLAGVVARSILSMQADAPPGALSSAMEDGADLRLVVHQATGMVSAQLDVTIAEAMLRLRAHAFATGRMLADVATIAVLQHRTMREAQVLNEQLNHALNSRIVIEQAKGVLSERAGLTMEAAFNHLRSYARSNNRRLGDVAVACVDGSLSVEELGR